MHTHLCSLLPDGLSQNERCCNPRLIREIATSSLYHLEVSSSSSSSQSSYSSYSSSSSGSSSSRGMIKSSSSSESAPTSMFLCTIRSTSWNVSLFSSFHSKSFSSVIPIPVTEEIIALGDSQDTAFILQIRIILDQFA